MCSIRLPLVTWLLLVIATLNAREVPVKNSDELRQALAQARPGDRIALAPGDYAGGVYAAGLRGESNAPIVIAAADPLRPPVIRGTGNGLHLTQPAHVELHNLVFAGAAMNGLNIDDGGRFEQPAHHVVLRGLTVREVGDTRNQDCIKLSGLVDFLIEDCTIARWGTGGGSGIDMVGCHRGLIQSNLFRHTDTTGSTGVQCKGGTSQIVVRSNRFENAGGRAVNIGGSTGRQFFRPPLTRGTNHAEARDIRVEQNLFLGGGTSVAFVGVDGSLVRSNVIYRPKRWGLRILQETQAPDFVPSRNGVFTDNYVFFHSGSWAEGGVNIGAHTAPGTFRFAGNWWYCLDQPERSRPRLPTPETQGHYGEMPPLEPSLLRELDRAR